MCVHCSVVLCTNPIQDYNSSGTPSTHLTLADYFLSASTSAANSISTSIVSARSAAGSLRLVQATGKPTVPNGPPSHTYRSPSGRLRSKRILRHWPFNGWNGCVTTSEPEDVRCDPALCANRGHSPGAGGPGHHMDRLIRSTPSPSGGVQMDPLRRRRFLSIGTSTAGLALANGYSLWPFAA